ncbi:MAG: tRNA pseudouridine(38-40) synthase TruA [Dehalococcoidales bacterium]|nr:tRNA pseudouridine(38-40) synthase TruA [Dehalococcoidales bacterium]
MVLAASNPLMDSLENVSTALRYALVVEYDGANYFGFQLQANQPTIQSELEKALKALTGETIRISASSRTDTGVHAVGQVVSFKTTAAMPVEAFVHGLNYHLPQDIAVKAAYPVKTDFDARRLAASREYTYNFINSRTRSPLLSRYAHRIYGELDIESMNAACRLLLGTQDFASFASEIGDEPEKSTVRHIYRAEVTKRDNLVVFTIVANAFIRHQVRNTAGILWQIGSGKMNLNELESIIKARQPGLAGPTLPACGLTLVKVNYPQTFEEMK